MAHYEKATTYMCWDDCQMSGCPGHTAKLEYQSTSDNLHFVSFKGKDIYLDPSELDAFIDLLHEIEPVYIHKIFKEND